MEFKEYGDHFSHLTMSDKFGSATMPNQGTQRVLVAGGSGQVSSLHSKAAPARPAPEYVDQSMLPKKDGAVVGNEQLYRKPQTTNFHTGATVHSAATAKSLNAIQGRFVMHPNGDNLVKYPNANNAYAEDAENSVGAKHGLGGSHNNATMAEQVRLSSKDGARKKKS